MIHDQRIYDRIRCVLLADDGWSAQSIAESQLIHETTVLRHIKDYQIVAYVAATYQVYFTVSGMHKWLIRHGFSYKKT